MVFVNTLYKAIAPLLQPLGCERGGLNKKKSGDDDAGALAVILVQQRSAVYYFCLKALLFIT